MKPVKGLFILENVREIVSISIIYLSKKPLLNIIFIATIFKYNIKFLMASSVFDDAQSLKEYWKDENKRMK